MRVGIVGGSGYLGRFLYRQLGKEKHIVLDTVIGRNKDSFENHIYLDLFNPQDCEYEQLNQLEAILFLAAVSSPDLCAGEYETCYGINVTGTKYFIKKALEKQCRVLFFSSDAVFGMDMGRIWDEESPACANTAYGIMKREIETAFLGQKNFKVIRLPYVVSVDDRFSSYILSCLERQETADIYHPFYRNAIGRKTLGNAVLWLLSHWEEFEPDILHVSGQELVSRIRIADEISRFSGDKLSYQIIRPCRIFYENRPEITQIKSIYNQYYKIWKETSFTEQIQEELKEWNTKKEH